MAYDPLTDFLTLNRLTSGGVRLERMPGLDFVVMTLERMGFCNVWVSPSAAPADPSAVWLKTSSTSWDTEGSVFLFDVHAGSFQPATPALWRALSGSLTGYVFQSVTAAADNVSIATTLLAVQRNNPGVTTLSLPAIAGRTAELKIVDFSTNVAAHQIILNPNGTETVMRAATFSLYSTAVQLAGITLQPCPDLNSWVIA